MKNKTHLTTMTGYTSTVYRFVYDENKPEIHGSSIDFFIKEASLFDCFENSPETFKHILPLKQMAKLNVSVSSIEEPTFEKGAEIEFNIINDMQHAVLLHVKGVLVDSCLTSSTKNGSAFDFNFVLLIDLVKEELNGSR